MLAVARYRDVCVARPAHRTALALVDRAAHVVEAYLGGKIAEHESVGPRAATEPPRGGLRLRLRLRPGIPRDWAVTLAEYYEGLARQGEVNNDDSNA